MTAAPGSPASPARGDDALLAVLLEVERHVAGAGWDGPARLFALVRTDQLLATEPHLAATLGPSDPDGADAARANAAGAEATERPPDALTAIEQEEFSASGDLLADLARIAWPSAVHGCAVAVERTFLPAGLEAEVPVDPAAAAAYVAAHPRREDVRVVVGVDRAGHRHGVARLHSAEQELLSADDLVPDLAAVLAHTLAEDA